jgi:hypothetical protein
MRFTARRGRFHEGNASRLGKLGAAANARKRMENPVDHIPRPSPGLLLHTIRVESHLAGVGFEIKVRQGKRLNQIVAETFGRFSKVHGCDWLARHLREKLVTRWMRA